MKFSPYYVLKWDKIEPASFDVVESDEYVKISNNGSGGGFVLRTIDVVFPEKGDKDILPEMLKETHDMRFMKHLKKYAAEGTGGGRMKFEFKRWMIIPIAFGISALGMFLIQGGRFF